MKVTKSRIEAERIVLLLLLIVCSESLVEMMEALL